MIADINPWLLMWSQPRVTIRVLLQNKPAYGLFYLAAMYTWQDFLYDANKWSYGLKYQSYTILLLALFVSPFFGILLTYVQGSLLYLTGRLLKGKAPASHLRAALAWSYIPTVIGLFMWLILVVLYPDTVFLQNVKGGPSSILISLITLIVGTWSFVLLIAGVREVQNFSIARSIVNVFLTSVFAYLCFFSCVLIIHLFL